MQRALRMVLMCGRRAEDREDAIASRVHDVAVVTVNRLDHQLDCGVDNCARVLRIEVAHHFGRALNFGEKGRDNLALPPQGQMKGCGARVPRKARLYEAGWLAHWKWCPRATLRIRRRIFRRARWKRRTADTSRRLARRSPRRTCGLRD